ncbi:hypothetical protein ABZ702_32405 [Streptomyces cyaneofuscatus]|uniref:hypothetical protein n=1 Tax=Streptomyces cyaneofuscatus TaxID=66883 RepID=UPI0033F96A60
MVAFPCCGKLGKCGQMFRIDREGDRGALQGSAEQLVGRQAVVLGGCHVSGQDESLPQGVLEAGGSDHDALFDEAFVAGGGDGVGQLPVDACGVGGVAASGYETGDQRAQRFAVPVRPPS